ncbi:MAG: 1-deoxy-D-xylulose-5-phosphate reductoisomerase [Pseudomonadota bacterium]|nr:1-deoxy-D-xylulose-5-phosphate reductoisomerase [Pseudomonadota bacterium]
MNITILGSTSTIGINTLSVISNSTKKFQIFALTAKSNYKLLFQQIKLYKPKFAVLICPVSSEKLNNLCKKNKYKTRILCGEKELIYVATHTKCDCIMSAIVGSAALKPTYYATKAGKKIFLANKESLIMSGDLLIRTAKKSGSLIIPVDSEHNSILQILLASGLDYKIGNKLYYERNIDKVLLTASGGPFLNSSLSKLKNVTPSQATKHPNWRMGKKISVDSATMMNKGLELIEANLLFGIGSKKIEVLIHEQSIIHAMVMFKDGAVISHMSNHDMKIPISYALSYPSRLNSSINKLDLIKVKNLTFKKVDRKRFKCLDLAHKAMKVGKNAPTILNAANEISVNNFLKNKIKFTDIPVIIEKALSGVSIRKSSSIDKIIEDDKITREFVTELINSRK